MFSYGTSYRIATMMFPRELRDAVLKLYSFVRVPDNIVDIMQNAKCKMQNDYTIHYTNAKIQLTDYYHHRQQAYHSNDTQDPIF